MNPIRQKQPPKLTPLLGIIANSAANVKYQQVTRTKETIYQMSKLARKWLKNTNIRTKDCFTPIPGVDEIPIVEVKNNETKDYRFRKLQQCSSVWACPFCSLKLTHHRRQKLGAIFQGLYDLGFNAFFLTLTIAHNPNDNTANLLVRTWRSFIAKRKFKDFSKTYQIEYIRILEHTLTTNGLHSHYHVVIFSKHQIPILETESYLKDLWNSTAFKEVRKVNNDHGLTFKNANIDSFEDYLMKWNLVKELLPNGVKNSLTAFQLLRWNLEKDDETDKQRFIRFCKMTKGKRQITFSRGLAKLIKDEITENVDELDESDIDHLIDVLEVGLFRRLDDLGLANQYLNTYRIDNETMRMRIFRDVQKSMNK